MSINDNPTYLSEIVTAFNQANNLQFLIEAENLPTANLSNAHKYDIETLLKKLAVYADKIIFLLSDVNEGNTSNSSELLSRVDELTTAKIASQTFNSIFYFLPSKIVPKFDYINDYFDDGGMSGDMRIGNPTFDFKYQYKNAHGYYIDLNDFQLTAHLFEKRFTNRGIPRVLNYWLPDVRNIPFDVFLKIREDEHDSFMKLQHAIRAVLKETNRVDSTEKLKELFEKVDYEVRIFRSQMEKVRKSKALRNFEMIVGVSIIGIGLAVDSEIFKIVASLLGSYSFKDFLENIFQEKDKMDDLRSSDFYIPWLLNEQNLKYS